MKEEQVREIIKKIIWKIAIDERRPYILYYNKWIEDNWEKLKKGSLVWCNKKKED